MGKYIDPNEVNIRYLFSFPQIHKVPSHQRNYSWKKDNWEDFFDDISELGENDIHFLGSIVVIPKEQIKLGLNYFEIQDGQQRLATILILMCVLRDLAKENGMVEDTFNSFIYAKEDMSGNIYPRLELSELDNDNLVNILKGELKDYSNNIYKCYKYFYDRIKNDFKNNLKERIQYLWISLLDKVILIHINAYKDTNAFELFETLNDRGLELSAVDLIKNFILKKVSNYEEVIKNCLSIWNNMFENVREIAPVKFFRRYMLSEFKGKFPERRLNKALRRIIENEEEWNNNKIKKFLEDLYKKSEIYSKLNFPSFKDTEINRKLQDLIWIEVGPSYTLLMKIFPFYENGILNKDDIKSVLELIESFHIRWGVCDKSTSVLDTIYNDICTNISNESHSKINSDKILKIIEGRLKKEIESNVNDDVFRNSFLSNDFNSSETRTKYILYQLSKQTKEHNFNIINVWTEHIMPKDLKKWEKYLSKKTNLNIEEIEKRKKEYLNKIGNLTIILDKWNINMSNNPFDEKKNYYIKSNFNITKELCGYDFWTFEEIDKRSNKLAELAVKIWDY